VSNAEVEEITDEMQELIDQEFEGIKKKLDF